MPAQDYFSTHQRHLEAVEALAGRLRETGMCEVPVASVDGSGELPPFSFQRAPLRSVNVKLGRMPRDFRARLTGETFSWKLYVVSDGALHSSLFRAVAYLAMDRGPYLQTVSGLGPGRRPISWLDFLPGKLEPTTPTGIWSEDYILDLIREQLQPNA